MRTKNLFSTTIFEKNKTKRMYLREPDSRECQQRREESLDRRRSRLSRVFAAARSLCCTRRRCRARAAIEWATRIESIVTK